MAAKKRNSRSATPLDAKHRALTEKQESLRREQERIQRMLAEAPKKQELAEKRRREELLARSVGSTRRMDSPTLLDKRFDVSMAGTMSPPRRRRVLKAEKRQARLTFFGLFIGLLLLIAWLYSVWKW